MTTASPFAGTPDGLQEPEVPQLAAPETAVLVTAFAEETAKNNAATNVAAIKLDRLTLARGSRFCIVAFLSRFELSSKIKVCYL